MNPHCACPLHGFCDRHQMMKGPELHKRCQGIAPIRNCGRDLWICWEQGGCGAVPPEHPVLDPEPFCSEARIVKSSIGTRLAEIIATETGSEIKCAECRARMEELDRLTQDEARPLKDSIVEAIVSKGNQATGLQAAGVWLDKLIGGGMTRAIVQGWFDRAVELGAEPARAPEKKKLPLRARAADKRQRKSSKRKPYTGWRSEADGPHLYLGPFESPTRALTYHVWPTMRSDCWRWNVEQLSRRAGLFNGPKVLGVAIDETTHSADEVVRHAAAGGLTFDRVIVVRNNPKLREVVTFRPMLEAIGMPSRDPGLVVFSAHAKGTQYEDGSFTRDWTELMYRSCLDYWPLVEQHLRHALFTGSFREFGLLGKWKDWAYSGTFYWWRAAEIAKREWWAVDNWFAGSESWPGKLCDPRETRCLFLNDNRRLYDAEYFDGTVRPAWVTWQRKMERQSNAYRGVRVDPRAGDRSADQRD